MTVRASAYAAWTWVVVFLAAHVYWYLGGTLARPAIPDEPFGLFGAAVAVTALVGVVAPLVAARDPRNAWLRRGVTGVLWLGCALLLVRGLAGVVDEGLRVTEVAPGGLTGLTRAQVTGFADPPASVLWTGRGIDAYFTLGGLLFGWAALRFARGRTNVSEGSARMPA